ncbi:hypothetical protein N7530_010364 [Penicillium desertorum]|uniref:Uncharacterized protein n=1 Tax=Penicillium desertorum TaxID=1303715 RepID=A0A9X0BHK5_9EURO|nr:hypothetical protein N7530_010364 [Penicillium desertorum]
MSATTATSNRTTSPHSILLDYEVHHSRREQPAPLMPPSAASTQPQNWPSDHYRVPPYRPTNRNLDQSERPSGASNVERGFIIVMLHGVWINATISRVWRFTGGILNDRIFHYKIGGEW